MKSFSIKTKSTEELVDITSYIRKVLREYNIDEGFCVIFVPHTTAGVTINENADPTVRMDIIKGLGIVPATGFAHSEGNSPAHIKSSLVGQSLTLIIQNGDLALGTWQGVYLAEFDGPRQRSVWIEVIENKK